jgi:hypothetical protein
MGAFPSPPQPKGENGATQTLPDRRGLADVCDIAASITASIVRDRCYQGVSEVLQAD